MPRLDGHFRAYGTINTGTATNNDKPVGANKSVIIKTIDFTAPSGNGSIIRIVINPAGGGSITVAASQSCKSINLDPPVVVPGGDTLRIRRDNNGGAANAYLGASVYYEEL